MLTKVRPEPSFVEFLISVAVVADQYANFSRCLADLVKSPGSGTPDLPTIQANKSDIAAGRQWRDQAANWHAFAQQCIDGIRDQRMFGGDQ